MRAPVERIGSRLLVKNGSMPTNSASVRSRRRVAKAASISRLVLALTTWTCSPVARAAALHVSQRSLRIRGIGRIDEHGHMSGCGDQLTQKLQPLRRQLRH